MAELSYLSDTETVCSVVEHRMFTYNIRHRSYYFSRDIVLFIGKQKYDRIYFPLFDQLLRSATSIGANLVEGMAGSSKNDFIKFNTISLKSANETKYWLCLIKDTLDIDRDAVARFITEADEISKIIASIIINTKQPKKQ
jgi:four helix bundle protein